MLPNNTCVPPNCVGRGKVVTVSDVVEKLLPNIVTSDPRAATGTLAALTPVAAFTRPFGPMAGVCAWRGNHADEHSNHTRSLWHSAIRT
jgi:hypothetical protein